MKTAVIYARYSSDKQTESSIEGQVRVCKDYASKNDITIVDTYIDRAMTGTNDNRFAFQKMLKDSANNQFELVLVYKLDRFSRNKYEMAMHRKTLSDNNVKLISCMENIPEGPEGIILESLIEGMAEYYSVELKQKVNRGLQENWFKGNATGGPHIFGYDVVDKKYVINPYEATIIKEIFTQFSQGYNGVTIAKNLNEKGYKRNNGKEFTAKYVLFLLHNSRYIGTVKRQGITFDNLFPAIISKELWQKVNIDLEKNKFAPSRKKEVYDYILTGKLICGDCKHKMVGVSGTSHTGDIHYYYSCLSRKRRKINCKMKNINKIYLEDFVIDNTTKLLKEENYIDYLAESIIKTHKKELADNTGLKLLIQQRDNAIKASKNIIKAIEQGIINDLTKERLNELENEIARLNYEINQEELKCHNDLSAEDISEYLKSKLFANTDDIKTRKLLVNTFIREIILYEDEIIITYNFTETKTYHNITKKEIQEIEKQCDTALTKSNGSYIDSGSPPLRHYTNLYKIGFVFFSKDYFGIKITLKKPDFN